MNIYLISQNVNNDYDTYDSAVVVAKNKQAASEMHPSGHNYVESYKPECWGNWCDPTHVIVTLIGIAPSTEIPHVVCSSFNAG